MSSDRRDLLEVLTVELAFLEKGAYRHAPQAAWRPRFLFQDSPTCVNFHSGQPPKPCSDCILVQLVPEGFRNKKVPCRYIPLNEQEETVDSLYRTGTQEELEAAVAQWLKASIAQLKREREESLKASRRPEIHVRARFVGGH